MVSARLKAIFAISIPIYAAHVFEEYWTDFYKVDPHYHFLFAGFHDMPTLKATFIVGVVLATCWMTTSWLLLNPNWQIWVAILPGLLFLFEFHHALDLLAARAYTPGAATAVAYPILFVVYCRQWLKDVAAWIRT